MGTPQVAQELKRDVFGRVERLDGPQGPVVRRVAAGSRVPGSRWVARRLLARERRALTRLSGVRGVTQLVEASEYAAVPGPEGRAPRPREVLLRSWTEGVPLYRVSQLPVDFFERLEDLVRELHARGVCHNDLHKEPNVLVDDAGYPALVDFQLASVHRHRGRAFRVRAAEDLRHVEKHLRVYRRGTGCELRPTGELPAQRRSSLAAAWMRWGKPVYNFVTRRVLSYRDGEARRPSRGPWPRWTPAVGPRPRG